MKKRYIVLIVIVLIISSLLLWSRFISTSGLEIKDIIVKSDKIPDSFVGTKIVHFSDLHYGRTVDKKRLADIVKQINNLNPDLVLFTGDLVADDVEISNDDIKDVTEALNNIQAKLGKYAIVGNHDYESTFYKKILEDSKFALLNNSYDLIYNEGYTPIFLGGLGSYLYNDAKIDPVMSYFDTNEENSNLYKILMIHEGDQIDNIKDKNLDLILGGHSHNGQVRLPFVGAVYKSPGSKNYYEPYYKVDNTDVYISNGIGCSVINFRFMNKPSINLYRLTK